ncbi:hypothetical protein NDU88_003309 [Pleurodeles waltl]|uniref:Uncharacterized protein n=1 Tax=Pleurodeles waltl TaxID=8319 RepID=A0AAV7LGP8_PLEWA|nr:hypothetical protein NDU88_003309 [Pleurodeles waltl]
MGDQASYLADLRGEDSCARVVQSHALRERHSAVLARRRLLAPKQSAPQAAWGDLTFSLCAYFLGALETDGAWIH